MKPSYRRQIEKRECGPVAILAEIRKQTSILERMTEQQSMLLQAFADVGNDDREEPLSYLSSKPR